MAIPTGPQKTFPRPSMRAWGQDSMRARSVSDTLWLLLLCTVDTVAMVRVWTPCRGEHDTRMALESPTVAVYSANVVADTESESEALLVCMVVVFYQDTHNASGSGTTRGHALVASSVQMCGQKGIREGLWYPSMSWSLS